MTKVDIRPNNYAALLAIAERTETNVTSTCNIILYDALQALQAKQERSAAQLLADKEKAERDAERKARAVQREADRVVREARAKQRSELAGARSSLASTRARLAQLKKGIANGTVREDRFQGQAIRDARKAWDEIHMLYPIYNIGDENSKRQHEGAKQLKIAQDTWAAYLANESAKAEARIVELQTAIAAAKSAGL